MGRRDLRALVLVADMAGISLLWTAICAGVGLPFSYRVNINEFSIHHFYKNRLVRCYLGASHTESRKPNSFAGFDPDDDLPLARFDHAPRSRTARKTSTS